MSTRDNPVSMMKLKFHKYSVRRDAISWMLVVSLLLLTLFPFHYHLHHDVSAQINGATTHSHVTELHILEAANDADHYEVGHTVDSAVDPTLKYNNVWPPVFVILLTLSVLLPLSMRTFSYAQLSLSQRLPRFIRHSSPPLRAPPF